MTCRGKGSQTELAGCTWNGKEAEQSINTDLTESSKSPASIAQSNKQWIMWTIPLSGMSGVDKQN